MSTHGCFTFFFAHIQLMQPDGGAPETAAPVDDYSYHYYPAGGYFYELADDQE
jgi:hypothetical protein